MGRLTTAALAGIMLGAVAAPGAALADGPGYGGTADALTVQWRESSELAVFAVGFKGGSPIRLRVGSATERTMAADDAGALRLTVLEAGQVTGTSVVAMGRTPAGALRTLLGSVPPRATAIGPADVAPWGAGTVAAAAGVLAFMRRGRRKTGRHAA